MSRISMALLVFVMVFSMDAGADRCKLIDHYGYSFCVTRSEVYRLMYIASIEGNFGDDELDPVLVVKGLAKVRKHEMRTHPYLEITAKGRTAIYEYNKNSKGTEFPMALISDVGLIGRRRYVNCTYSS